MRDPAFCLTMAVLRSGCLAYPSRWLSLQVTLMGQTLPTSMAFSSNFTLGRHTFSFGGVSTWHTHGHRLQHVNLFTGHPCFNVLECRLW